jgi:hypothetical protein
LASNNILIPQQHEFQKGKSTVTALFDFATEIYEDAFNPDNFEFSLDNLCTEFEMVEIIEKFQSKNSSS